MTAHEGGQITVGAVRRTNSAASAAILFFHFTRLGREGYRGLETFYTYTYKKESCTCYGEVRLSGTHSILSIFEYAERWWVVWIFWGGPVGGCGVIARSGDLEAVGLQYRGMYTCCKITSKSRESKEFQIQSLSFSLQQNCCLLSQHFKKSSLIHYYASHVADLKCIRLFSSCSWHETHLLCHWHRWIIEWSTVRPGATYQLQKNSLFWCPECKWWCRRSVCDVLRMCVYVSLQHPSSSSWPVRASIREFQFKLLRLFWHLVCYPDGSKWKCGPRKNLQKFSKLGLQSYHR